MGMALAGVALLLLGVSATRWFGQGTNWMNSVPDGLLVALMPWSDGSDSISSEVSRRIVTGEFDPAGLDAVLERCIRGDRSAPPGSEAWERRYGPILSTSTRMSAMLDPKIASKLLRLPCRVTVEGPAPWPLEAPTRVHVSIEHWWLSGVETRVRVRPRDGSGTEVVAVRAAEARRGRLPVPVAALAEDVRRLELEIDVERRAERRPSPWAMPQREPSDPGEWSRVGSTVITIGVEGHAAPEAIMAPLDDRSVESQLQSVFSGGFMRWSGGVRRFGVLFNPTATATDAFRDVAIGLRVEVLQDGVPRRISNLWWMGGPLDTPDMGASTPGSTASGSSGAYAWEILMEDAAALDAAVPGDDVWTLRVTGDREVAVRATAFRTGDSPGALRWFAGTIEVPLRMEHRDGTAPPRPWMVEAGASPQ